MTDLFTAFLLFNSLVWTIITLSVFVLICLGSDLRHNGYVAFVAFLILSILYYVYGNKTELLALLTLSNIITYLAVGFVYSLLRTLVEGYRLGRSIKSADEKHQKSKIEDYKDELKDNVFRWWFLWWMSIITWAFGDLLSDIFSAIYHWAKHIYTGMLDAGIRLAINSNKKSR